MRLQNKVVLVTASTSGIGLATVKACAKEGAIVYMAARNLEKAENIAAELKAKGHQIHCVYNDAEKPESFVTMVEEAVAQSGRIDVLVNNFGISDPRQDLDFMHTAPDYFFATVEMNLKSVFLASQTAAKHMAANGGGSIVNISSVGGIVPDISQVAYGTSKAAIDYLTKLIAVQGAARKIRCNAVLPGMTETESVKNYLSEDFKQLFLRHIPLSKMGQPEEIAAAVVYFAGDESAYTTGQILTLSGGFGLATPIYGDIQYMLNKR